MEKTINLVKILHKKTLAKELNWVDNKRDITLKVGKYSVIINVADNSAATLIITDSKFGKIIEIEGSTFPPDIRTKITDLLCELKLNARRIAMKSDEAIDNILSYLEKI